MVTLAGTAKILGHNAVIARALHHASLVFSSSLASRVEVSPIALADSKFDIRASAVAVVYV
jgi:hypothetical protein